MVGKIRGIQGFLGPSWVPITVPMAPLIKYSEYTIRYYPCWFKGIESDICLCTVKY